jgi:hypothetical protein
VSGRESRHLSLERLCWSAQKPHSPPPNSSHLSLRAEDVTYTQAQWDACVEKHEAPLFGCPICFLMLAEKAPYAELGMAAAQQLLSLGDVDVESLTYARALVADISSIPSRIREHLRQPKEGGAA